MTSRSTNRRIPNQAKACGTTTFLLLPIEAPVEIAPFEIEAKSVGIAKKERTGQRLGAIFFAKFSASARRRSHWRGIGRFISLGVLFCGFGEFRFRVFFSVCACVCARWFVFFAGRNVVAYKKTVARTVSSADAGPSSLAAVRFDFARVEVTRWSILFFYWQLAPNGQTKNISFPPIDSDSFAESITDADADAFSTKSQL